MKNEGHSAGLSIVAAAAVVAGVLGFSAIVGRRNAPGGEHPEIRDWYRDLDKPGFTPPDPVFGAVWPVLEAAMAVGGYRLLRRTPSPRRNTSVALWLATTGMIGGWSELFFRGRALGSSAVASGAMLVGTGTFVVTTRKVDRVAQAAAVPLVAWLAFATMLATRVWQKNRPAG